MRHKAFVVFLVLAAAVFTAWNVSPGPRAESARTSKGVTRPVFSAPFSFPARRFPTPPKSFPTRPTMPGYPSGYPTPRGPNVPIFEFDWMDWWQINVSYLMKTRDDALFYQEAEVTPDDVPAVLSLLDYSGVFYPVAREMALRCLEKLDEAGVKALREIVAGRRTPRDSVHPTISASKLRGLAAYALGLLRVREADTDIIALMNEVRPEIRMLAALALGHIGTEAAENTLLEAFPREKNNRVAAAEMIALALIGSNRARNMLLASIEKNRQNPVRQAFSYLSLALLMRSPSYADINKALFSGECHLWLAGLTAKAALLARKDAGRLDVNKIITQSLNHCDKVSGLSALFPLYLLGPALAKGDIGPLLTHRDPTVRAFSRFIAAMSGSADLAKAVIGNDPDEDKRAASLQSLAVAWLAAPDRAEYARRLLDERDKIARIAAILALAPRMSRMDVSRIKGIVKAEMDRDMTLAMLYAFSRAAVHSRAAWNELARYLFSSNKIYNSVSLVLVGATGTRRAARFLLDLKGFDNRSLPYSIALSLLGPLPYELVLRNGLESMGDVSRASAVLAYSFVPLESARALLFERLDSDSIPLARAHAAFGLLNYASDDLTDEQRDILVEQATRGPDDWVRCYAALALGKFAKDEIVARTLEEQLENPNINIKAMAAFGAGIYKYPKGVSLLRDLIAKERTYAVLAQIVSLGLYGKKPLVPYFGEGIKYAANDQERLAFAAALSSVIGPEDYSWIIEKLSQVSAIDAKTYAWTLALHNYPGQLLSRKVVAALRNVKPGNDMTAAFHLALVRCAMGDGAAARDLLKAASSRAFYYHPILPEPRFLLEYFQKELPDYHHIVPYFFLFD